MGRKTACCTVALLTLLAPAALRAQTEGDPYTLRTMQDFNGGLKALWMDIQVEQVEYLTISEGRPASRMHRQPFRWVAGDSRRQAEGSHLTYLVEHRNFAASGLDFTAAEAAIDQAAASWAAQPCLSKLKIVKRADTGADADIFDSAFGYGGYGDYRLADVVHAGWMPPGFFDAIGGQGSGENVISFSVTFIYVGPDGKPTDINHDGYLDTATNEIYYNEAFAWLIGGGKGMDLQTVALHEIGHSLGLGHVGPPLEAVMSPVYSGVHRNPEPIDGAALCTVWGHWPN
jgi:hypothetical protein